MTRTVCTVTGTRAEYGLLRPVLRALAAEGVTSRLLVTGAHLAPGHGSTVAAIEADGLAVDERVEVLLDSDTAVGAATSMGLVLIGVAPALRRIAPDVLLVLGDRYETLGAALAAHLAGVPVAHLHGGETTAGAVDDALRHALTKVAALHLVAAEPFARAVVALGEDPARVHVVGAPGLDEVHGLDPLPRATLEEDLGVPLRRPTLVVTYHPATLGEPPAAGLDAVLGALDGHPDATVVATHPGADAGGRAIAARLDRWASRRTGPTAVRTSLGQRRYLSLVAAADAVVGNSSSGIIEAPALGTPTVDVGERQRGRLRGPSVLHAEAEAGAVAAALATALSPAGRALAAAARSPYGDGHAAPRIARLLAAADLDALTIKPPPAEAAGAAAPGGGSWPAPPPRDAVPAELEARA